MATRRAGLGAAGRCNGRVACWPAYPSSSTPARPARSAPGGLHVHARRGAARLHQSACIAGLHCLPAPSTQPLRPCRPPVRHPVSRRCATRPLPRLPPRQVQCVPVGMGSLRGCFGGRHRRGGDAGGCSASRARQFEGAEYWMAWGLQAAPRLALSEASHSQAAPRPRRRGRWVPSRCLPRWPLTPPLGRPAPRCSTTFWAATRTRRRLRWAPRWHTT